MSIILNSQGSNAVTLAEVAIVVMLFSFVHNNIQVVLEQFQHWLLFRFPWFVVLFQTQFVQLPHELLLFTIALGVKRKRLQQL